MKEIMLEMWAFFTIPHNNMFWFRVDCGSRIQWFDCVCVVTLVYGLGIDETFILRWKENYRFSNVIIGVWSTLAEL